MGSIRPWSGCMQSMSSHTLITVITNTTKSLNSSSYMQEIT